MSAGVIGCVWGAHRRLLDRLGVEAPSYEWCEQEWGRLRKTAPAGNALPLWLENELFWAWRAETVRPRPRQLALFGAPA